MIANLKQSAYINKLDETETKRQNLTQKIMKREEEGLLVLTKFDVSAFLNL